jgi:hypothetical protein
MFIAHLGKAQLLGHGRDWWSVSPCVPSSMKVSLSTVVGRKEKENTHLFLT